MLTGKSPFVEFLERQVPFQIKNGKKPTLGKSATPSKDLAFFLLQTLHRHQLDRPDALELLKNDNFVKRGKNVLLSKE